MNISEDVSKDSKQIEADSLPTPQQEEESSENQSYQFPDDLEQEEDSQKLSCNDQEDVEQWEDLPQKPEEEGQISDSIPPKEEIEAKEQPQEEKITNGGQFGNYVGKQDKIQRRRQIKSYCLPVDTKYIYASFFLLRKQFKQVLQPLGGFLKFNPYLNSKEVKVFFRDESKKMEIIDKVEELIQQIQAIEIGKHQAESGVQLSYKYMKQLQKQNITIFKDRTENFKRANYYICGRVPTKKLLHEKLSEIRKMSFVWIHIFKYENTRSYRAILRKLFDTPQIHDLISEKFKYREVEVAYLRKDHPLPVNTNKKGILILLTNIGEKKITIHQEIEKQLTSFIEENFLLFCFTFMRKKESHVLRYAPKLDKVIWFFITDHNPPTRKSFLYIIVRRKDFNDVRDAIINQIQSMKLNIYARRFFNNFLPGKPQVIADGHVMTSYPKSKPYSFSLRKANKAEPFDWISQLKF